MFRWDSHRFVPLRRPCFDKLSMRCRVENNEKMMKAPLSSAVRREPKGYFTTCLLVHDTSSGRGDALKADANGSATFQKRERLD
jgi:hypothetical protein